MATESVIETPIEEAVESFSLADALESDKQYRYYWAGADRGDPSFVPPGIQGQVASLRDSLYGASVLARILRVDTLENSTDGYQQLDGNTRGGLEAALCELLIYSQGSLEAVTKFMQGDR